MSHLENTCVAARAWKGLIKSTAMSTGYNESCSGVIGVLLTTNWLVNIHHHINQLLLSHTVQWIDNIPNTHGLSPAGKTTPGLLSMGCILKLSAQICKSQPTEFTKHSGETPVFSRISFLIKSWIELKHSEKWKTKQNKTVIEKCASG